MKVFITVGISASGKTTWAKEKREELFKTGTCFIISRDDIRHEILEERGTKDYNSIGPVTNIWNCWKFGKDEKLVTERWWERFKFYLQHNAGSVICADTNLNKDRLNNMISEMNNLGVTDIEVVEFPVTLQEAWKRDAARPDGVGQDVIWKQYLQWLEYKGNKVYKQNHSLPSAVMVDLDGTLAKMVNRSAFEWDKVDQDDVHFVVAEAIRGLHGRGIKIIIMTGRDGVCNPLSLKWLSDKSIPVDAFYSRSQGDMRDDATVKEELFWEHVAPSYNVLGVFDDRPKVCRKWRELGLKVFQVDDPLIEF